MVNVTKKFGAAAIALAAVSAGLPAQQVMQVNVDALGPQVGQKALMLRLPDQNGRQRDLNSVAGPKGTMLVFFRSADW